MVKRPGPRESFTPTEAAVQGRKEKRSWRDIPRLVPALPLTCAVTLPKTIPVWTPVPSHTQPQHNKPREMGQPWLPRHNHSRIKSLHGGGPQYLRLSDTLTLRSGGFLVCSGERSHGLSRKTPGDLAPGPGTDPQSDPGGKQRQTQIGFWLLAVQPSAGYVTSLSLRFLICKIGEQPLPHRWL